MRAIASLFKFLTLKSESVLQIDLIVVIGQSWVCWISCQADSETPALLLAVGFLFVDMFFYLLSLRESAIYGTGLCIQCNPLRSQRFMLCICEAKSITD